MATLNDAVVYATEKHADQTRRAFDVPFICHPLAVLSKVMTATRNDDAHQAAVLHDVVEDTDVTIEEITQTFGSRVGDLVLFMTQDKTIRNYYVRRLDAVARMYIKLSDPFSSIDSFVIKLSDNIDNMDSFTALVKRYGPDLSRLGFDLNRTIWYLDQLAIPYDMARIYFDDHAHEYDEYGQISVQGFKHLHDQFVIGFNGLKAAFYGG